MCSSPAAHAPGRACFPSAEMSVTYGYVLHTHLDGLASRLLFDVVRHER